RTNVQVVIERNDVHGNIEQQAVRGVKAVGDIGHAQGAQAVAEQGIENMRQHVVGAVAHKHLVGRQAVVPGNGLAQRGGFVVGVQLQVAVGGVVNGLQGPG